MTACRFCHDDPELPVLARWSFVLPISARSQNALSGNKGGQRWAYKAYRDSLLSWFTDARLRHGITPATGMRRVIITRLMGDGGRRYDHANLVGGCKPVLDALVHAGREKSEGRVVRRGIIYDDSPKWMRAHYRQRESVVAGMQITIEELTRADERPRAAKRRRRHGEKT